MEAKSEVHRLVLENDLLARSLDFLVEDCAEGEGKVRVTLSEKHMNGGGRVHGGALFVLADYAFALAINQGEEMHFAANCNISYYRSAYLGETLTAHCRPIKQGSRIDFYETVICNQDGELIAKSNTLGCVITRKLGR